MLLIAAALLYIHNTWGIVGGCTCGYLANSMSEEGLPPCLEPIAWTCGRHHSVNLDMAPREVGANLLAFSMSIME